MLNRLETNSNETAQNKEAFNVVDVETNKINGVSEQALKCIPQSDFIYNGEMLTISYLETLPHNEIVKIAMGLLNKNIDVQKDNEQFRQKNFQMYLELRKLKKE